MVSIKHVLRQRTLRLERERVLKQAEYNDSFYGEPKETIEEILKHKRKRRQTNIDADAQLQVQKMWDVCWFKKGEIVSAIIRDYIRQNGLTYEVINEVVRRDRRFYGVV